MIFLIFRGQQLTVFKHNNIGIISYNTYGHIIDYLSIKYLLR